MNLNKIIKIFYFIYTIFILLAAQIINIDLYFILPAILLMWSIYLVFVSGYIYRNHSVINNSIIELDNEKGHILKSKYVLFFISLLSIIFAISAVNYYTGQTPISVYRKLSSGISLYSEYQNYFQSQQRYILSFSKLPFIFMLFFIKLTAFYSYIYLFLTKDTIEIYEKLYLFTITLSFIYVGIARGTNFEFFELTMIIIFILLFRNNKIKFGNLVKMFSFIMITIAIYLWQIEARGANISFNLSKDFNFIPSVISIIIERLYGYFGFGFFYIGNYIVRVWFSSIGNLFAGLIPYGYIISDNLSIANIMSNEIHMGARWHPDMALIINSFGIVGLILICFVLGLTAKYIQIRNKKDTIANLTLFIILMQMISLPVGNFIGATSASQLIIIFLMTHWSWRILRKG